MEGSGYWERKIVINELMQGHEFTNQLRNYLSPSSPADLLTQKILSSFNKALSMMKSSDSEGDLQLMGLASGTDSPHSFSGSPRSENSNRTFRDPECGDISKKRKTPPKWSEKVRAGSGPGLEGPPDDGFNWRKYGQKDILGAKHPRAYYRCTHRNVQGCAAKKQVQRTEEDPTVFHVQYQGTHTCLQTAHLIPATASQDIQGQQQQQQVLLNFRTGLKVKTEELDSQDLNSSSFSFPSASIDCGNLQNCIFSSPTFDNHFLGSFSSPFISPATSEANYFSMSPCHMNSYGGGANMPTSDSDLNEIISAVTSASNSPLVGLEFALDPFNPNLPFDDSTFLS